MRQDAGTDQQAAPSEAAAPETGAVMYSPFSASASQGGAATTQAPPPWYLQLAEADLTASALVLAVAALLFLRLLRKVWEA